MTQLNRGEGRHAVARITCHGQRGEIRKRYREGQEDQLGALGLVTNAVVLWNIIHMDAARNYLEQQSIVIKEEDEASFHHYSMSIVMSLDITHLP